VLRAAAADQLDELIDGLVTISRALADSERQLGPARSRSRLVRAAEAAISRFRKRRHPVDAVIDRASLCDHLDRWSFG